MSPQTRSPHSAASTCVARRVGPTALLVAAGVCVALLGGHDSGVMAQQAADPIAKVQSASQGQTDSAIDTQRDELRRRLVSFVIVDYLGTGLPDHENKAALYADTVDYYGRERSRAAVMAEKRAYYKKWPTRQYDFIESSLVPKPGANDAIEISFRYTFSVFDGRRRATGTGATTLELVLQDDRFVISREAGRVLNQSSTAP